VVRQATQVAAQTERSVEEVLASWLESAISELPIEQLSDSAVLALTELQLTDEQQATLSRLLTQNQEGTLGAGAQRQLDELMRLYEHGLLRKSQALRVAVQRGLIQPLSS
jgi:DNA-binding transcriptional ArsR family regulator